jgi:hypothetical protein
MNSTIGADTGNVELQRIRELLEAHSSGTNLTVTETVDGVLSVSLDARMRVVSASILDGSVDSTTRANLERAIVDATNRAMARVVQSSAEALQGLHQTAEWQRAAADLAVKFRAAKS